MVLSRLIPPLTVLGVALALSSCGTGADGGADALAGSSDSDAGGSGLVFLRDEDAVGPSASEQARPYYHDFGSVMDGERVSHTFRLRNTEPAPVSILRVVPSCGCTVPTLRALLADGEVLPGAPINSGEDVLLEIPPDAILELDFSIDTRDVTTKNVDKLVQVQLTTDAKATYYIGLEAHIYVERPFDVVPPALRLGKIPVNGGGRGSVQIVRAGKFQRNLTEVIDPPEGLRVELFREDVAGHAVWRVQVEVDPPVAPGGRTLPILVGTVSEDGTPGSPLRFPVTWDAVADVQTQPPRLAFPAKRDAEAEAPATVATLLEGHRIRVVDARVSAEHAAFMDVGFSPVEPDSDGRSSRWSLLLKTRPPLPEGQDLLQGQIDIELDDPQNPEMSLPYVVHVR